VEVTVGGQAFEGARAVSISGRGVTGQVLEVVQPTEQQIRDAQQRDDIASQSARIRLTIAPNAPDGVRDLRILAKEGLSSRFRFEVSTLPEFLETEPNSHFEDANQLPDLPIIVNGQITNADRDFFRFHARAGQKLLLQVQGRSIKPFLADAVPGWFQPRIALYNHTGEKIAEQGYFRFDPDPVMFFNVPADDDYTVEIWDTLSRGRDDIVYRLKIGELPYLTDIFPIGGPVGDTPKQIMARGINLPGRAAETKCTVPSGPAGIVQLTATVPAGKTNSRPFELSTQPEITEEEPNDLPREAQRLTPPVIINGQIGKPGDRDTYSFHADAGDKLVFNVMARRLGSPLDARITLYGPPGGTAGGAPNAPNAGKGAYAGKGGFAGKNGKGANPGAGPRNNAANANAPATPATAAGYAANMLAMSDDEKDERFGLITNQVDPRLTYTFKKTGTYYIALVDVQNHGGPEYAYRLHITPPQPDFDLRITPDNLILPAGGNAIVQLKVFRLDGFTGPIRLHADNLPPGFDFGDAGIPKGKDTAFFTLAAPLDAKPGIYTPHYWAEAEIDGKPMRHDVSASEELLEAFYNKHTVLVDQSYLVVNPKAPFRVEVTLDRSAAAGPLELPLGKEIEIPVRITREPIYPSATSAAAAYRARQQGKNAKGQFQQNPQLAAAQQPIIVTVTRGRSRGMVVTPANIEPGQTTGVIKILCTNVQMVGQEDLFIIEATQRARGVKNTAMAPALPFKILPNPDGEKVELLKTKDNNASKAAKNQKKTSK